jgi:universal stress protein A
MIPMKNILLPTDFSEFSKTANAYACEFTDRFQSTLHILHVLQLLPTTTPTFGGGLVWNNYIQESRDAAKQALDAFLPADWVKSHDVRSTILAGSPFAEILRYAADNSIDMIVMATHGHSGLTHMLMGSVAERVVRKSHCPVLTVRPESTAAAQ